MIKGELQLNMGFGISTDSNATHRHRKYWVRTNHRKHCLRQAHVNRVRRADVLGAE